MKFTTALSIATASVFLSLSGHAHEGHDHDGPSSFQPQNGGIVKSTEEINVEVVTKDSFVKLYFYDMEGKIKPKESFGVTAEAQVPKSKKKTKLVLTERNEGDKFDHYEISDGPKNVHRYTLALQLKEHSGGHNDKLTFTIEPKE